MRTHEAVALNKKLLTNNPQLKNAPFYNENYISIFDSANNIDSIFLKQLGEQDIVEYGEEYRENMSPKELLKFIETIVQ